MKDTDQVPFEQQPEKDLAPNEQQNQRQRGKRVKGTVSSVGIRKGDRIVIGNRSRVKVIKNVSFSCSKIDPKTKRPYQPIRINDQIQMSSSILDPNSQENRVIDLESSSEMMKKDPRPRIHFDPRKQSTVSKIEEYLRKNEDHRLNLVLDLDETLLSSIQVNSETYLKVREIKEEHATSNNLLSTFYGSSASMNGANANNIDESQQKEFVTILRPHLREFLADMNRFYRLCVYSHGRKDYVMKLLNLIDPKKEIFSPQHIFKNEGQVSVKTQKDIRFIIPANSQAAFDTLLKQSIIVDDLYEVWVEEAQRNIVPVKRFQPFFEMLGKSNPCVISMGGKSGTVKFQKTQVELFQDLETQDYASQYLKYLGRYLGAAAIQYYSLKLNNIDRLNSVQDDIRLVLPTVRKQVLAGIEMNIQAILDDEVIEVIKFMAIAMGALVSESGFRYVIIRKENFPMKRLLIDQIRARNPKIILIDLKWVIDSFFLVQQQDITYYFIEFPSK